MEFEWDANKAASNADKHGVTFEDAVTVFTDINALTVPDVNHSELEQREFTVGTAADGRILALCHTDRADKIRIISARLASRKEKLYYAKDE